MNWKWKSAIWSDSTDPKWAFLHFIIFMYSSQAVIDIFPNDMWLKFVHVFFVWWRNWSVICAFFSKVDYPDVIGTDKKNRKLHRTFFLSGIHLISIRCQEMLRMKAAIKGSTISLKTRFALKGKIHK